MRILRAGSLVLLLTSSSLPLVVSGTHPGAAGEGTAPSTPPESLEAPDPDPTVKDLMERDSFAEAESLARKQLAEADATHGPNSAEVADALDLLFEVFWWSGRVFKAETREATERAMAIRARLGVENKVFGLRRAFQVSGAGTLIMSLWSVEDESAREWMRSLYEGRLQDGLDTAQAVRNASLTVLNNRRERGESTHPFYWAGFVAAGDWR